MLQMLQNVSMLQTDTNVTKCYKMQQNVMDKM